MIRLAKRNIKIKVYIYIYIILYIEPIFFAADKLELYQHISSKFKIKSLSEQIFHPKWKDFEEEDELNSGDREEVEEQGEQGDKNDGTYLLDNVNVHDICKGTY